jgi:Skp family chaperone for outer membrane proteins
MYGKIKKTNNKKGTVKQMKRLLFAIPLLCLTLLLPKAQAEGIGYVDYQKVVNAFTHADEAQKQLQDFAANLRDIVNRHQSDLMLTTQEREELKQLLTKQNLTDSEKKRLQELETLASDRLKELQNLENLQNLTEAQKQRLNELQTLRQTASKDIDAVVQEYNNQINQKGQELWSQLEKDIRARLEKLGISVKEGEDLTIYIDQAIRKAIEQVAKANNLSLVLSNQVVLYGGVDITDKVIQALTK